MVSTEDTIYDINVKYAFKSYGENNVINDLNMNIKSGSIYGLLGPSGCGKSTLLRCILGLIPLDSGYIYLKAQELRDVGYMSQDACLDDTLTIQESFNYYGALYDMSKEQIKSRIVELSKFLEFPKMNNYIKNIKGCQCKRVSLGISILHDPKIIILDEPTVGIDSLMRHNIWTEFTKMAELHKKTIIITTHYVEEANEANCIGLIRNGKIIEEGSPRDIQNKYNTNSLESVFLTLYCHEEVNQTITRTDIHNVVSVKYEIQSKNLWKTTKRIDYNRIKTLMKKNLQVLSRDYILIFALFIIPIIQSYSFCASIGVDIKGMSIAVKNDEINYSNCRYSNYEDCIIDKYRNQTMSCVLMDYFSSFDYNLIQVNDLNDGERMMKNPNYVAFIHFPKNYTKELIKMVVDRQYYDVNTQPYIHFTNHNIIIKNKFLTDVVNAINYLMNVTLNSCINNPRSLQIPMEFNTIVGKEVKSYNNNLVSVFMAITSLYFPSIYSVNVLLPERMDGILSRSMLAGVTALELLISMFCIANVIIIIQSCVPLLVVYILFSNPILITNGLIAYLIMIILLGWIGFFCGILAAGILPTRLGAIYTINGWTILHYLLSGVFWPVEGQSQLLRTLSEFLPVRVAGKTMTDITLKGWTLEHPSVITATTIMFAYVVVFVLVLTVLGKLKKDMWVINK